MSNETEQLLNQILDKHSVLRELFDQTLKEEKSRVHLQRRREITKVLRHIIEQKTTKDGNK